MYRTGTLVFAAMAISGLPLRATEPDKPKLLVLVVFDQMRGDYLSRWKSLYGADGFIRLQNEGVWFTNCHYPYANTQTGPGHASLVTGCGPDKHGIVGNNWYDSKAAEPVYCGGSERYARIPPQPKVEPEPDEEAQPSAKKAAKQIGNPDLLLSPTIGDGLKEATGGKAKVIGLSFKDRAAVLMAGKKGEAYWLGTDGQFVTSSYYRDALPAWLTELNKSHPADRWFGKDWTRFRNDIDYEKYSGPDDVPGEGKGIKQGIIFPHPIDGGLKKPGKNYYEALFNSPYGNDLLLELTRAAVLGERLGKHEVTDLLVVSFSSNDAIGHVWGPDSQEVLDVTLRSDRIVADLLSFLDTEVGKGKYLLALTADHGICPLPEVSAAQGKDAKRFPTKTLALAAENFLRQKYDEPADKARWVSSIQYPWIYLNHQLIEDRRLKPAEVAGELAGFLAKKEGVARVFTRKDLEADFPATDPIGRRMKASYYPPRSGDLGIVNKPYYLLDALATGTNHGTPHPYDTFVPLIVFGPGVLHGTRDKEVAPQTIAAIFARAAGIDPPRDDCYPVPEGVFK